MELPSESRMTVLQPKKDLTLRYGAITVPSTFDPARRPIYVHPIASLTRKNESDALPLISQAVVKVAVKHPNDKILVHTVSYKLTASILKALDQEGQSLRTISYTSASEKQRAIDRYLYQPSAILLAPSLDRGIDLPDDDCRCIVVCKVPFPNLADKQISARLHTRGGQAWYSVRTVRSLIQMTGRGMRHDQDYCESYILDKSFIDQIWRRHRNLLPKWWTDALVWNRGIL
jgi:ATP-dependent DNA helicase DinG